MDEFKKAGQNRAYIDVPGYDIDQAIPREEKLAEEARDVVFHAEAERLGITDLAAYLKSRQAHARDWPRAADLESPDARGQIEPAESRPPGAWPEQPVKVVVGRRPRIDPGQGLIDQRLRAHLGESRRTGIHHLQRSTDAQASVDQPAEGQPLVRPSLGRG